MVRDADAHAKEDRERREQIEKRNQLDSLIYGAEKTLRDNQAKLPEDLRKSVEEVLAEAKRDLESGDAGRLDAARERVEREMHKVAEVLYKAQGAPGGSAAGPEAGGPNGSGGGDDVIDAEYTEEK
jgi:molecular chaperone DnaK